MRSASMGWITVDEPKLCVERQWNFAWNQMRHLGLLERFKLFAFPYRDFYYAATQDVAGSWADLVRVFQNQQEFYKWEMAVEMRAVIDIWLEEHEWMVHMKSEGIFQDALNLLTKEGRKFVLQKFELSQKEEQGLESLLIQSTIKCPIRQAIVTLTLLCHCILSHTENSQDQQSFIQRPWLRHLQFNSILANMCWDGIQIMEKSGLHSLAVPILTTLLRETSFHQLLLSRRTRGKVQERLIIDQKHAQNSPSKNAKKNYRHKSNRDVQTALHKRGRDGSLPFSALRNLAKRLKLPLSHSLRDTWNGEAVELRLRTDGGIFRRGYKVIRRSPCAGAQRF